MFLRSLTSLLSLSFLVGILTACGQPPGVESTSKQRFSEEALRKKLDHLVLTSQQKQKLEQVSQQFKKDNRALLEQVQTLRTQLRAARAVGDDGTAADIRAQLHVLKPRIKQAQAHLLNQIESILTSEQRQQFAKP